MDGADRTAAHARAYRVHGEAVAEIHVVDRPMQGLGADLVPLARTEAVTEQREDRRLIEGGETLDPVTVAIGDQRGVVGKPADAIPRRPAAEIVERLRQVPVIEAEPRLDARRH